MGITAKGKKNAGLLTEGSIAKGILAFAIPLFLGQLLQQFYNVADAWVVGNFADNDSFAAVSSAGSLTFLIIGFFQWNCHWMAALLFQNILVHVMKKAWKLPFIQTFYLDYRISPFYNCRTYFDSSFASSDADTRECAFGITIVSACIFRRRINYYHV